MRTVDTRHVRAFRLRAQHLAQDFDCSVLTAAAGVCGLQDTPPGGAAVGLGVRVPSAGPDDVAEGLSERRDLVIVWSRRGSPYLVPSADLLVFTRGLEPDDDDGWATFISGFAAHLDGIGMSATEVVEVATEATRRVLDGAVLTKRELGEALRPHLPERLRPWFDADTYSSFSALVSRGVALKGVFVMAPRSGNAASFVRTDQWLEGRPQQMEAAAARAELVRRYLHAYGPSTAEAYAAWAGISPKQAERSFALVQDETEAVAVSDGASACDRGVVLGDDLESLHAEPGDLGLRMLPPYDAYLAAVDRQVVCPDVDRHGEIWKSAANPGVVLADGDVVGTWRARKKDRRLEVTVQPWTSLHSSDMEQLEVNSARVSAFRGCAKTTFVVER